MSWIFGSSYAQNQADNTHKLRLAEVDNAYKLRLAETENATKQRIAEAENATKQRIAEAENATKLRLAEIHANEKEIAGGTGGKGGKALKIGGNGGLGEGTRLTLEEVAFYRRIAGQREKPLVPPVRGEVPHLTTADFCKQYRLSAHICKLLVEGGFETAEGLVNATTAAVAELGLKPGHIAELTRGLKKFIAEKVK